jgi:polysaccharide pyruvyl transferase WcaK-like protein
VTAGRAGWGRLTGTLAEADGFVAVGGGYLRSGSVVEQIGVAVNHLPQLLTASRSAAPSCYFPQSIGPLHGPSGRMLRSALERIDRVWVRDDTSLRELDLPNTEYMPDLVVLSIAEQGAIPVDPSDEVLLVARALDRRRPTYLQRLRALVARLDNTVVWGTQAEGASEKSDAAFYSSIDVAPAGSTSELLIARRPAVVVSVRLHGSLMSIAAGCPTVHLSYQRKGWAAMRDLGLAEWVHDAGSFDPEVVADQVDAIREDPSRYWETVAAALTPLRRQSRALDDAIADLFGPGRERRVSSS